MTTVVTSPPRPAGVMAGTRAMFPLAIGCAPFGMAVGATIASSNVDIARTLAAALLMFGGSAQLAVVQMLDAGAAPLIILAAAVMINLRFVAYSAALAPLFPTSGRVSRAAMASTLVDQTYLVTSIDATNNDRSEPELKRFYVGASATIAFAWVGAQVVGVLAGSLLPEAANLGAAAPISLAGLAAGVVSARASRLALAAAVAGCVVLSSTAGQLALVMAILVGVGIAATFGHSRSAQDR
ncbi:MAG TPA: AzlC family ABC transporter permease [Ilumatobacteraceae bacterium]|nr:AzlC family ABC transporter permease [Ilumatobacteraceae bacterium]